jgi:glutathione S-transferase
VIRLYRIPYSTNVERVALALAHKGLAAESIVVEPADRSLVRRVSGQELVPVIEDDGEVVSDSTRILEYLEERYPEPPLYPREPARRAETIVFVDWFNRVWKVAPNALEAELRKRAPDRERVSALGGELTGSLEIFEAMLDGRLYLMGPFGAADCVAFPFLKYGVLHDEQDTELFHRILVDYLPIDERYPRLRGWIERMDERPRA